jgi:hypothetical protein
MVRLSKSSSSLFLSQFMAYSIKTERSAVVSKSTIMVAARSDAPPGMSGEYSSAGEVKKMKFGGRVEIALNVAIRTWSV